MAAENAYKYYDYAFETAPEKQPVKAPQKEKKPELRKVKKTQKEIRVHNEKIVNRKTAKVAVVLFSFFAVFAVACGSFAARDTAKQNLENKKEEYVYVQAKNRELKVKLNSLISAENIDRIATEELGLVKVSAENEIYLDTAQENKVILSQDN